MNYNNIANMIRREAENQGAKTAAYIMNGTELNKNAGIEAYSTTTRWNQYKRGEIDREEAAALAIARDKKQSEKRVAEKLESLNEAGKVAKLLEIDIMVEFKKSKTWGYNPHVEARIFWISENGEYKHGFYMGTASGCGYDKESAAIADALNKCPAALKMLYDLKEAAPEKSNRDAIGYGSGYGAVPYFEGGVGVSCFVKIAKNYGMETTSNCRAKYTNFYNWKK